MFYFQEQCLFFSCLCGDATRRLCSFWNIVNYVQCDGVCFVMFFKQSLDSVFAISVLIKVSRLVFKHVPALAGNALSH